jgi:hypothetical protein
MSELARAVAVAGLLIGCHTSDPGRPDATTSPDGQSQGGGLQVTWGATPTVGALTPLPTVAAATFRVDHLHVVGDAGPDDNRTAAGGFLVNWGSPQPLSFSNAPPGTYSQIQIELEGDDGVAAFVISGQAMAQGSPHPYAISSGGMELEVTLPTVQMLAAGASLTIEIDVAFDQALATLDFDALCAPECTAGSTLSLEQSGAQMPAFRTALEHAVSIVAAQ